MTTQLRSSLFRIRGLTRLRRLPAFAVALFMVVGFNIGLIVPVIGDSLGPTAYADAVGTGRIAGHVFQDDGAPIPNATVKAYASPQDFYDEHATATTTSAADGAFELSNLPDGNYLIMFNDFRDPGSNHNFSWAFYDPQGRSVDRPETISARVTITGGSTVSGIEGYLSPGGDVSGHVTDSNNQPLAGITVSTNRSDLMNDPNELPMTAVTDAQGSYLLRGVPAQGPDNFTQAVEFNTDNPSYQQQWYNVSGNATIYDNAGGVSVIQGQTTENIDAQLPHAGKITGTLTDNFGKPLPNFSVYLYAPGVTWDDGETMRGDTDAAGHFAFTNLAVGSYTLDINDFYSDNYSADYSSQWFDSQYDQSTATPVVVTAAGNTDASTHLNRLLDSTVTVTSSANPAKVGQTVTYTATITPTPSIEPNPDISNFTGMVVWTDNGQLIWGTNCPFTPSISGVATCSFTYTSPGAHTIQANWHGDMFYKPTISSMKQIVTGGAPTNKDQCKNNGWQTFTSPSFKNEGQCVSYAEHNN